MIKLLHNLSTKHASLCLIKQLTRLVINIPTFGFDNQIDAHNQKRAPSLLGYLYIMYMCRL